ncbi:MAG: IS30 family transposase, partial [Candidatus Pacebacteria bacterium]|nr:IS30 family transposase [Candidatus Paceibacterota bacterium]
TILLATGESLRAIARRLNRSDSTIRDEIKRNRFGEIYVGVDAQAKAEKRVIRARTRHPLKNKSVYGYVLKKLRSGWSPEQISGRLKLKKPDNPYWNIHHETIYRFIYAEENKVKTLWEYLPRKQKKRKKKYGRKSQKVRIPDRVSIHDRPSEIENRKIFGHWEGDSIESKAHRGGMHTEIERKTGFTMAAFIKTLEAEETASKASQMFRDLPPEAKKSTTLDNGKEFTKHKKIGISTYFADPYSSWQRGTNENTNGLIRRYLPKKTDFSKVTQSELDDIICEINNRPRKRLGFYTPKEMFEKELLTIGARIPTRM